jgi:hypothetical protein
MRSKKSQNQLLIELFVKHRMYNELREFKRSQGSLSTQEKYLKIQEILNRSK